ncbi:MAG: serine/threonine protein kinase [Deltaproteobacteria bacterium]|nr:serine/threonine protein kinase [Deltaproteobacteria bacterium]
MLATRAPDPADEPPPRGTIVAGKYRVGASLGRGGMGHVVSATHEQTGKEVALKWIRDPGAASRMERFAREARALGRIRHPNVVDVYDVVEHEGRPCLVMERVEGGTLATLLTHDEPLAIDRAIELAIEIGRGVAAAHACGVIHRDLKPANVLVLPDDEGRARVKIIDFGISKLTADEQALTVGGATIGTPRYAAPEQVRDASTIDARVDVYALGAILYEMLAGRPPHQHPDPNALMLQILSVAPRPLALSNDAVSRSLSDIVDRALAKDPEARVPSMDALVALLRQERASVDMPFAATLVDGARALDVETLAPTPEPGRVLEGDTVPEARAHAATLVDPAPRDSIVGIPRPHTARHVWLMVAGLVVLVLLGLSLWSGEPDAEVDVVAPGARSTPSARTPLEPLPPTELPAVEGSGEDVPRVDPTSGDQTFVPETTPPARAVADRARPARHALRHASDEVEAPTETAPETTTPPATTSSRGGFALEPW